MKNPIIIGILTLFFLQGGLVFIWLAQEGINKLISQTDNAKNWDLCVKNYENELWLATSTSTWIKVLKICGDNPYIKILPS